MKKLVPLAAAAPRLIRRLKLNDSSSRTTCVPISCSIFRKNFSVAVSIEPLSTMTNSIAG